MIKFIKNWLKAKRNTHKEVKRVYKKVLEPKDYISRNDIFDEDAKRQYRSHRALENILTLCSTDIRPDQEYCPPSIINEFKQIYRFGIDIDLHYACNIAYGYLTRSQQDDLINKVKESKEYKEFKTRKRLEELSKDFN